MRPALVALLLFLTACGSDEQRLVGTWRPAEAADSLSMRYTFFADGGARIVARPAVGQPLTVNARYDLEGDSLLTLSEGGDSERFRYRLSADTLWLQSPATSLDAVFVRVGTP